jgi:uncharacterized membrane protein SirB2
MSEKEKIDLSKEFERLRYSILMDTVLIIGGVLVILYFINFIISNLIQNQFKEYFMALLIIYFFAGVIFLIKRKISRLK